MTDAKPERVEDAVTITKALFEEAFRLAKEFERQNRFIDVTIIMQVMKETLFVLVNRDVELRKIELSMKEEKEDQQQSIS